MGCDYASSSTRGLGKNQLGGVIFGSKNATIHECLSKQLFGLPSSHFVYVKKIEPGLPLFLFNYTDKTLLGIFEAASSGQMNIDPYAWTCDGSQRTQYPAQVQIRVKLQCQNLTENQFKPIIIDNYHSPNHFWFELDHAQTNRLLSILSSQAFSGPRSSIPFENKSVCYTPVKVVNRHLDTTKSLPTNTKPVNMVNEKDVISMKLKELALKRKLVTPCPASEVNYGQPKLIGRTPPSADGKDEYVVVNDTIVDKEDKNSANSSKKDPVISQLIEKVEDLMASKAGQNNNIIHLKQKIASMEQSLAEAQAEIKKLKGKGNMLEVETCEESEDIKRTEITSDTSSLLTDDSILLVGGYDGESWLSSLDCYSPSHILSKSLNPMNTERCYAAVSKLDGEIFMFGGGTRGQWFDTVECYDPVGNRWTTCPPLNQKKGSLAGATVNDKIYAVGGGNGVDCYSTVEMLDFDVGAWIPARSMLEKRFALAAAELNGAIYAVGGYDGKEYSRTAERFDPREHSWKQIESMNTKRGCPCMVVLNEKLFVLGGYDGNEMVSSVEIYDPRRGSWMLGEPMNHSRGFAGAAVTKDSICIFGGLRNGEEFNDTVECYKEGQGWEVTDTNDACRRCFFSAIAV